MNRLSFNAASWVVNLAATLTMLLLAGTIFQWAALSSTTVVLAAVFSIAWSGAQKNNLAVTNGKCQDLAWLSIVLLITFCMFYWVFRSGYIPWRDNDAFHFWMPKAQNILKYGRIPFLLPSDPDYTLHPSYPPSMLSLSVALQIFSDNFSWKWHRLSLGIISCAFFLMYLKEFVLPVRRDFGQAVKNFLPLFLLTLVQLPLWANGYHDVQWILGWGLLWSMFKRKTPLLELFALFTVVALAKNEALMFCSLTCFYFAWKQKRLTLLFLMAGPVAWTIVKWHFAWSNELFLAGVPQHSIFDTLNFMAQKTWEIVQFKTSHGLAGASLVLGMIYFWKYRKSIEVYFCLIPFAIYLFVYLFSGLNMYWHVQFSWPRLLIFPALVPVFVGLSKNVAKINS